MCVHEDEIYRGVVTSVKSFGAFIELEIGGRGRDHDKRHHGRKTEGMCHVSQISDRRVEDPHDVLRTGQSVFVKVTRIREDGKISLNMKDVDQMTGQATQGRYAPPPAQRKRTSMADSWELNQMQHAYGVKRTRVKLSKDVEDPFAEVDNPEEEEAEEEVEVELNGDVPPFLAGKTDKLSKTREKYRPPKAGRVSDDSMERLAENGSRFMSEAREKKMQQKREAEREKKRLERTSDPMTAGDSVSYETAAAISAWKKQGKRQSLGIKSHKSIREQRESLPVFTVREDLLKLVKNNDMLVVVGETGSGKTTQITQYLAESGYGEKGIIACTQPRRVAATSVAKRVAEEVGCRVGEEVGYQVRFEEETSAKTIIKYMTDGMLEREALVDPDMRRYSVIMLDEAHERTVATDVLFALLRDAARKRKGELKLIVTSATLDSTKFSNYFDECPVFHIKGRTFPVKVYYTKEPEHDYIEATIDTVVDIHANNPPGDILVFLTGQEEIETCCEALVQKMTALYKTDHSMQELVVLPIYSAMPSEMQSRIFEPTPAGKRKVVVATNIAETSITIDGIYYVVDPGFVKVNAYDPRLGMDSLMVQPISRAQADQRSGRAGRTGPGICYRLYTKRAYQQEMKPNTVPEIQRQNLSNTILMLKAMGIEDVVHFGFMDSPEENTVLAALQELYILDALDEGGHITPAGRSISHFPMEPILAKTVLDSVSFECSEEVVTIVAMLCVPDIFYRPHDKREKADRAKRQFDDYSGDHLTLLNVYEKWEDSGFSRQWCQDHYVHDKSMRKARDVRKQLVRIMQQIDQRQRRAQSSMVSCRGNRDAVRRAFVSGYFKNCAKRADSSTSRGDETGTFRTLVENTPVQIHPSSALFRKGDVDYVIYHTLVLTNKEYMHCITKIDPKWLVKYAPKFYKQASGKTISAAKRREKIHPLWNRYDQEESWRLSKGRR